MSSNEYPRLPVFPGDEHCRGLLVTGNLGIRMTMAYAKDLKYVNTLGTNTLLITV